MPAVIFSGTDVKTLKDNLTLNDNATFLSGDSDDPTVVSKNAPAGSLYIRTDGQIYRKTDAGDTTNWELLGSAGGGAKNYVDEINSTFEGGANDWFAYAEATADYVDGTGGAPTVAKALTTTAIEVLEGAQSLELIKPASDVSGEGLSIDSLTVDRADRGKVLNINISGDFSNVITSGDWEIRAFDVTNTAILFTGSVEARAIDNLKGLITVPVYTETTTEQIRLSIHMTSTDATAYSIFIDEVKLGPSNVSLNSRIDDWQNFTPTGTWTTNTTYVGKFRRVGDTMVASVAVQLAGAPDAVTLQIDVPLGLTVDTSKLDEADSVNGIGTTTLLDSGTAAYAAITRFIDSTTLAPARISVSGSDIIQSVINATSPFTFASPDRVFIDFEIPILEWANSNLVLTENQLGLQTVKVRYTANSAGAVPNSATVFDFPTVDYDTHNAVTTGASWNFNTPKTGFYTIKAQLHTTGAIINQFTTALRINTTNKTIRGVPQQVAASFTLASGIESTVFLNKGDLVDITHDEAINGAVYSVGAPGQYIDIEEVPDFNLFGVVKNNELIEDEAAAAAFGITAGQYGDLTSFVLTPGEWEIRPSAGYESSGATTTTLVYLGISTTSGNSAAGLTEGLTLKLDDHQLASGSRSNLHVPTLTVNPASPTTYFLKGRADVSITNLNVAFKVSARRIR